MIGVHLNFANRGFQYRAYQTPLAAWCHPRERTVLVFPEFTEVTD